MTWDDVRVAARTLRKQPGFTTVVVLSLALAIALNTTMYGVLDALIHPRVDIREPDRLFKVRFFGDYKRRVSSAERDSLFRIGAPSVEGVAWYDPVAGYRTIPISVGHNVAETSVGHVSVDYFPLMGPRLVAGRLFRADDETAVPRPIILGELDARTLFPNGANPLGATVTLADSAYTVIGVLSRYAEFPESRARAWTLSKADDRRMFGRMVRVRPGVTREQLDRELQVVSARIAAMAGEPATDAAFRIGGATVKDLQIRALHEALIVAVISVLLVACANVGNMQLARGIARGRELALRAALGATRARIVGYLLTETALLAFGGLVLGLMLTWWGASAMSASIPPSVGEYIVEPRISWRIVVVALAAATACIVLAGVVPAIKVSRVDPNEMLKSGHGTGATRRNRRQYAFLVVVEMALALALLSESVVTVRGALAVRETFWRGYDVTHLATGVAVRPGAEVAGRPLPEVLAAMRQRIEALPGVSRASVETSGGYDLQGVTLADSTGARELSVAGYDYRVVSPTYVRTRGLAIIAGRDFMDGERDQPAIIVDELTARKLWPNANPVGALMKLGSARSTRPFVRVVGVYALVNPDGTPRPTSMNDLLKGTIGTVLYLPGMADSVRALEKGFFATVMARSTGDPSIVAAGMRRSGVTNAATMDQAMGLTTARISREFMAKVFTLFAVLALGLAAFGIYGVVAHSVAERRRELGVRVALGATANDILHAVLRESVIVALVGVAVGLLLTRNGVMLVGQLSYEDDVFNAPLFAGTSVLLLGVVALSALAPARRATRIDPTESLRSE